ncbi:bifunctional lysylphosphatidylglycerol flippase/synthetase MprF [Actinobaculum suis]|uniref:bifunctional lysylphosphatidylglycerol flippase/synthetase MprF n=1 Tax=Actinobaculum suis TaxID=1657 RepID=UPI0009F4C468|nr:bifunctional lysylphosphatidylglycerol flippase/synthetase MprF [Actinobaculum suis]
MKDFIKKHSRVLKIAFYVIIAIAVVLIARNQVAELSGERMHELLASTPRPVLAELVILAFVAFSATGLYDVFAAKSVGVELPTMQALKIGWIAQAFNNFAGLGGLTGGTIRARYYSRAGADPKKAVGVSVAVWAANLLGLFAMLLVTLPFAAHYDGRFLIVPIVACLYIPFYFLAGRLHFWKIDLRKSVLGQQNARTKLGMFLASLADWLAAAVFFWICVCVFVPDVSLIQAIFVYATATLVGLLSFIPAGLGTFDVTVFFFFERMGADPSGLALALVAYRITYYLLPWLAAALYWAAETVMPKIGLEKQEKRENLLVTILWIGMFCAGVVLMVSAIFPRFINFPGFLRFLMPHEVARASRAACLGVGLMLVILSRGIRLRVSRVRSACLILLVVGIVASVARGLDIQMTVLLALFALLLYFSRGAFVREPLPFEPRSFLVSLVTAIGIPALIFAWRWIKTPVGVQVYPHAGWRTALFYFLLVVLIAFALLFSNSRAPKFEPPTTEDVTRFEDFVNKWGATAYTHLYFLGDKQVFYSDDGKAALMYRSRRNTLIALGDPIGDPDSFEDLLDEFVSYAEEHGSKASIYEISAKYLAAAANTGYSFVKIGEDATVDLSCYSNVGNKGKIFRRMRNRMGEKGTHFEMVMPPFTEEFIREIRDVSDAWLNGREEMGFSLGFFDTNYLSRAPIAVVRGPERVEGFASLMPMEDGVASVDIMRIRPDAPGGTMDGIFVSLIEWAKENGYAHFNLGMAPLSNTGTRRHSRAQERIVRYIYDFGNRMYNFKGLRSYKEKFKPRWHSRYLVYSGPSSLAPTLVNLINLVQKPDRTAGAIPLTRQEFEHLPTMQGAEPAATETSIVKAAAAKPAAAKPAAAKAKATKTATTKPAAAKTGTAQDTKAGATKTM